MQNMYNESPNRIEERVQSLPKAFCMFGWL